MSSVIVLRGSWRRLTARIKEDAQIRVRRLERFVFAAVIGHDDYGLVILLSMRQNSAPGSQQDRSAPADVPLLQYDRAPSPGAGG
jgi:hypothetical protein